MALSFYIHSFKAPSSIASAYQVLPVPTATVPLPAAHMQQQGNSPRTVTTDAAMYTMRNLLDHQTQTLLQEHVLATQHSTTRAMQHRGFADAWEDSQPSDLFAMDSRFDLPLYQPTASAVEAHSTASHAAAPAFLLSAPASTVEQPFFPLPRVSRFPENDGFCYTPQQPLGPADCHPFPIAAQQRQVAHMATFTPNAQPAMCHPSAAAQSYPLEPLPPSTDTLIDDPLSAGFPTTQPSRPHILCRHAPCSPEYIPAAAAPRTGAITKPRRKKIRPKDTINTLQQQIEGISSQIQDLTLRNGLLHRKKRVLGIFMQELAHIEGIAAEIQAANEQHKAHPSMSSQGAAAFQSWTPGQFGAAYLRVVTMASQWITRAEASTGAGGASPLSADVANLQEAVLEFLRAMVYSMLGRVDFMGRVMAQQLQLFADTVSEEEHWDNVLTAMNLNERQVENLLVAREVYLQYCDNASREHDCAAAALQQCTEWAGATSGGLDILQDTDQVTRLATYIQKIHTLNLVLTMFWFTHILTPMQAAVGLLRAYPLIPSGMLLSNALYVGQELAPREPILGPQPCPVATACTAAALTQHLTCDATSSGPSSPSSAPAASESHYSTQPQLRATASAGSSRQGRRSSWHHT